MARPMKESSGLIRSAVWCFECVAEVIKLLKSLIGRWPAGLKLIHEGIIKGKALAGEKIDDLSPLRDEGFLTSK